MEGSIKEKGLKVKVNKTKACHTGGKTVRTQFCCRYARLVYGKRVQENFIMCTRCESCMRKRCSEIWRSITEATNFRCQEMPGSDGHKCGPKNSTTWGCHRNCDDIESIAGYLTSEMLLALKEVHKKL